MKRALKTVFVLFLLLSLCSILGAASAAADPEALTISNITVLQDDDDVVLQMTFHNTGETAIDEFGVALAFLDENGYQIFGYPATQDGYYDEICNWYYNPETPIAAGGSYDTEDVFANYVGTTEIGVAIRYYHLLDGGYVLLPESEWQWIFPHYEALSGTMNREYYLEPDYSLYDSIGDFSLGYRYYLLDDFNAYYYGKNQGGEWITQIEPGSSADRAGLQVGDLVLFVNAVKPTENLYAVEYGMAAIAAGETVDWVYERDGVIYVTRVEAE